MSSSKFNSIYCQTADTGILLAAYIANQLKLSYVRQDEIPSGSDTVYHDSIWFYLHNELLLLSTQAHERALFTTRWMNIWVQLDSFIMYSRKFLYEIVLSSNCLT